MFDTFLHYILYILAIMQPIYANQTTIDIAKKFRESKLVPDVTSVPPTKMCQIVYKRGPVIPGEIISNLQLKQQPNVTWDDADPNSLYTLYVTGLTNWTLYLDPMRTDPGTTKWPQYDMWHQWVMINIPGNQIDKGENLFPYHEIFNPPMHAVIDRYCFLIYKQKQRIIPPTPKWGEYDFQEFCPPYQFVNDYNLTGPVAGNYFLTRIEFYQYKDAIKFSTVKRPIKIE